MKKVQKFKKNAKILKKIQNLKKNAKNLNNTPTEY